jgi:hypothetical protein
MAKPADNFLRYGEWLMGRIRWSAEGAGQAATGFIGILTDLATEGLHQAFYSRLPGHPQQAADSLDVTGADRELIKYSPSPVDFTGTASESQALWKARVQRAWVDYEQGGTPQVVLRGVEDWGKETFGILDGAFLVGSATHDANVNLDVGDLLLAPEAEDNLVLHCDGSPGRLIFLNLNSTPEAEIEVLQEGWSLVATNDTVSGTGHPYHHEVWWKVVKPYESFTSVEVRCKNLASSNKRFIGRAVNVSGSYVGNPILEVVKSTGDGTTIAAPELSAQGFTCLALAFIASRLTTYSAISGGWQEIEQERTAGTTGIGVDEQWTNNGAFLGSGGGDLTLGATAAASIILLTVKQQPQYAKAIDEYQWARFIVEVDNTPWGPAVAYGTGPTYGDGTVYGLDAHHQDVQGLKKTIRKWQPKRSRGHIKVQTEVLDEAFTPPAYDGDVGADTGAIVLDGTPTTGTLTLNCDGSPGNLVFLHLACERLGNSFAIQQEGWTLVASQNASGSNGPYHHEVWYKIASESFSEVEVLCTYDSTGSDAFMGRAINMPGNYAGITSPIVQQDNLIGTGTAAIPGPVLQDQPYNLMGLTFLVGLLKPNYTPFTGPGATSWTELGEQTLGLLAVQHQYKEFDFGSPTSSAAETTWGDGVSNTWGRISFSIRQTDSITFPVG